MVSPTHTRAQNINSYMDAYIYISRHSVLVCKMLSQKAARSVMYTLFRPKVMEGYLPEDYHQGLLLIREHKQIFILIMISISLGSNCHFNFQKKKKKKKSLHIMKSEAYIQIDGITTCLRS